MKLTFQLGLIERCRVNRGDNDGFVGIRTESGNIVVHFPLGYELPTNENVLRKDILKLLIVLSEFPNYELDNKTNNAEFQKPTEFPLRAYLDIINHFITQNGYFTEKETQYKIDTRGKINWSRTIKSQQPLIQSNTTPFYTKFVVRSSSLNDRNLITQIHKYCVYESFSKLGWLFTSYIPEKPLIQKDNRLFLSVLYKKLENTYNDMDRKLLISMISMIKYLSSHNDGSFPLLGTYNFEHVWEKLINKVFGIRDKQKYFPKTRWILKTGNTKINSALEPDTIMFYKDKIYVLDAKYYRFGITGNPNHLPQSSSINKQITYGEYVYQQMINKKKGGNAQVYNAFIMPFNANNNCFNSNTPYLNIGEATGDWKRGRKTYERVQGILIDTRYLIHQYIRKNRNEIVNLANSIENCVENNDTSYMSTT